MISGIIAPDLNHNNALEIQLRPAHNEPKEGDYVEVKARDPKHELQKWTNKDGVFYSETFPHFELGLAAIGVIEKGSPLHQAFSRPGTHLVILDNKSDVTISVTVQGTTESLEIAPRDSKSAHVLEGSVLTAVSSPSGTFISPASKRVLRTEAITYTAGINLNDTYMDAIHGWLPCRAFSLLYKVPGNDYTPEKFHELCDNEGPTLVIITSDKGNIFGGYNDNDWAGNRVGYANSNTFLFTLKNPAHSPPRKLALINSGVSSYLNSTRHVCFGHPVSPDLWLQSGGAGTASTSSLSNFYPNENIYLLDGDASFNVKEVSVYKVTHVRC